MQRQVQSVCQASIWQLALLQLVAYTAVVSSCDVAADKALPDFYGHCPCSCQNGEQFSCTGCPVTCRDYFERCRPTVACLTLPPKLAGVSWRTTCSSVGAGGKCFGDCQEGYNGPGATSRCTASGWTTPVNRCVPTSDPAAAAAAAVTAEATNSSSNSSSSNSSNTQRLESPASPAVFQDVGLAVDSSADPAAVPPPAAAAAAVPAALAENLGSNPDTVATTQISPAAQDIKQETAAYKVSTDPTLSMIVEPSSPAAAAPAAESPLPVLLAVESPLPPPAVDSPLPAAAAAAESPPVPVPPAVESPPPSPSIAEVLQPTAAPAVSPLPLAAAVDSRPPSPTISEVLQPTAAAAVSPAPSPAPLEEETEVANPPADSADAVPAQTANTTAVTTTTAANQSAVSTADVPLPEPIEVTTPIVLVSSDQLIANSSSTGSQNSSATAAATAAAAAVCAATPETVANTKGWPDSCINSTAATWCTAQCSDGYTGSAFTLCNTSGNWSTPQNLCKKLCTAPPPKVPGVKWSSTCTGTPEGTNCTGSCPYDSVGRGFTSQCGPDGVWLPPSGDCNEIVCQGSPGVTVGVVWPDCSGHRVGESCVASRCAEGFSGTGAIANCMFDGSWYDVWTDCVTK